MTYRHITTHANRAITCGYTPDTDLAVRPPASHKSLETFGMIENLPKSSPIHVLTKFCLRKSADSSACRNQKPTYKDIDPITVESPLDTCPAVQPHQNHG